MSAPLGSTGIARIEAAFRTALQGQHAAVMPYFTLGYPNGTESAKIISAIASHSDLLELGIPFSDPIADGPTIQRSTQVALEQGATVRTCLLQLAELRDKGVETPALLMGYYNPMLAYGLDKFVDDAARAGADGFIVPDLPPEESEALGRRSAEAGLALIYFLAPTSSSPRIEYVVERAQGFIYLVSLTGVTGARGTLDAELAQFVSRVRAKTRVPLAVGFGISTPEQAVKVGRMADGVIAGSALIDAVDLATDKAAAASRFVRSLRDAVKR
jgi:tryptophan synthase alpha chain